MLALKLAHLNKRITEKEYQILIKDLADIADKTKEVLAQNENIAQIAKSLYQHENALYLGRSYYYPVALEGALKIKEISYIHAEGCAAGEMKHGPIALVDENLPVVFVALQDENREKIMSNIQEIKAREGKVIAIITQGNESIKNIADFAIEIPKTHTLLSLILAAIPLQLLAYHVAVLRQCDVDQPRNLAKSVTVE